MEDASMRIRVSMVGPARVGKTTLLTAVLENAREMLAGNPVTIGPADPETEMRLRANEDELTADLLAGEFRAGSLAGTQEVSTYQMVISPNDVPGHALAMDFVDYPGALLAPPERRKRSEEWAAVEAFLKISTALLVPVDAVVLMEARTPDQRRAIPTVLGLSDVRKVAEDWAKGRAERLNEPALVIISPVKCESYFTDHGGRGRDRADELVRGVQQVYGAVIDTIRREAVHAQILYAPVDSIGCVELIDPRWQMSSVHGFEPDPEFLVRPPGRRNVLGAKDVLSPLVRQVVAAGQQSAEIIEKLARDERERASELAGLGFWDAASRFGFWSELFDRLDGVKAQRKQLETVRTVEAKEALQRLTAYENVLDSISNRSCGPRVYAL